METQLHLVVHADDTETTPSRPDWRIDDAAKARGRAGIALARAALAEARLTRPMPQHESADHTTAA
jgi:hypothetical protein